MVSLNEKSWLIIAVLFAIVFFNSETKAQESQVELKGQAEFASVSGTFITLKRRLPGDCRNTGFECIKVKIKNNTTQVITIHGDKAQAEASNHALPAALEPELIKKSGCGFSFIDKSILFAATVTTVALAEPILQEMLEKADYPQTAYGQDAIRQMIEGERLGRRLLMPGDETTGWLCVASPKGKTPTVLRIPVQSATDSGLVVITITNNT